MTRGIPFPDDILFTTEAPLGNAGQFNKEEKFALAQRIVAMRPKSKEVLLNKFLVGVLLLDLVQREIHKHATGSTAKGISADMLKKIKIPIPSLEVQKQLVAEAEKEEEIIATNRRLIDLMERKIDEVLAGI